MTEEGTWARQHHYRTNSSLRKIWTRNINQNVQ
jgi:hypothetical protein